MDWNMFIFWAVIIFFGLIILIGGTLFLIFWNRRKLTFTKFLTDTGIWENKSWKPNKITNPFVYDNETYKFNIKKCTQDHIHRPIAHYYKGNPEQQEFDFSLTNKKIIIQTKELTAKDFTVLMLSKVLRDIFQDDEVMNLLMIIIVEIAVFGIVCIILIVTHRPDVTLASNNQTVNVIASGVKQAIQTGMIR
jgi:hypothetical protein